MPDSVSEWGWWIVSTIVVGFILSIVANLVTPIFKQTGQGWLQRIRLRRERYHTSLKVTAIRMIDRPNILLAEAFPHLISALVFLTIQITFSSIFIAALIYRLNSGESDLTSLGIENYLRLVIISLFVPFFPTYFYLMYIRSYARDLRYVYNAELDKIIEQHAHLSSTPPEQNDRE